MRYTAWLAAALAAFLAVLELGNATRKPPAFRAGGWILVLCGFDASSGLIAHALLLEVLKGLAWFGGVWPALMAGLCGPALLRAQLALLGSGQESVQYGPAVRYNSIRKQVMWRIDQLGAGAQTAWVVKAIPKVTSLGLIEFETTVTTFIRALGEIGEAERDRLLNYVGEVFKDPALEDSAKERQIIQWLLDKNFRQCIEILMRQTREK